MPMLSEKILFKVVLTDRNPPSGKTLHTSNGKILPAPAGLAIAQLTGDPGFYLYYFDSNGNVQTDTYHSTVEQAKKQAALEFNVNDSDW